MMFSDCHVLKQILALRSVEYGDVYNVEGEIEGVICK